MTADSLASLFHNGQFSLLLLALCALLLALILQRQRRQLNRQRQRLKELDKQLTNALQRITRLEDLQDNTPPPRADFERHLQQADLKSRLQQPQPAGNPPDKYRHVIALAAQGLDAEAIAEVLQIAPAEASQLLTLARLRQRD